MNSTPYGPEDIERTMNRKELVIAGGAEMTGIRFQTPLRLPPVNRVVTRNSFAMLSASLA